MSTQVSHPSLAETMSNVFLTLLPMSSSPSCPSSRTAVFRVFRVLMPVSCSASCPCLPNPLARYHFALRLVITLSSRSSSLRSHARVFCGGVFRGMNQEISEGDLKTNLCNLLNRAVGTCRDKTTYRFAMI